MQEALLTLRKEIKYVIPLYKALLLRNCLDNLLSRDDHCDNGVYSVRSLYFDSVNNIDFAQKLAGISNRKKVRARIYDGDTSLCKLELKEKRGDLQHKQSFLLSKADIDEISCGNYSVLKNYFDDVETSVRAYSIMEQGKYRPVVLIEYDRTAYQYPMYDTRITLDMNIRSTESNLNIFASQINFTPLMYEDVILEIKYNGKLMGFLSDILTQFDLTQSAYSKYCSGRKVYCDFNY